MKYQAYDETVSAIAEELKIGKPNQWVPYTFLRGPKLFRQYMEQESLPYSIQEARIWLDINERAWKHHTYNGIRHSLLLVAQRLEPDVEVMQILYLNLSSYQQLPPWAVVGLEEFHASPRYQNLNGNIRYDSDRINISKFLIWMLRQDVSSFWVISISLVMEYCRDNGVQRGIKPFLCYLRDKGVVSAFLPDSYDSLYCSRVLSADDLHLDADTLHRFKTEGYVTEAYRVGILNAMAYLHDHHYSASACKNLKGPLIEMGVFLELTKIRFSKELALAWRSALMEKTGTKCVNARRGLLLVVDILADKTGSLIPGCYRNRESEPPDWSKAILQSYLDERALDDMEKSRPVRLE